MNVRAQRQVLRCSASKSRGYCSRTHLADPRDAPEVESRKRHCVLGHCRSLQLRPSLPGRRQVQLHTTCLRCACRRQGCGIRSGKASAPSWHTANHEREGCRRGLRGGVLQHAHASASNAFRRCRCHLEIRVHEARREYHRRGSVAVEYSRAARWVLAAVDRCGGACTRAAQR